MEQVSYLRLLLYGFLTYAAIFMLWSLLYAYGLTFTPIPRFAAWIFTAEVVFFAAKEARTASMVEALRCGFVFALTHIALDFVYIAPAAGLNALMTNSSWVSYAIVFLTPFVTAFYSLRVDKKIS